MDKFAYFAQALTDTAPAVSLYPDEPLSLHTTFRIGGPAALLAVPPDEASLAAVLKLAASQGIPFSVLGNGSNLLAGDGRVERLVIKTASGLTQMARTGPREITCGSGVTMEQAALFAARHGLTGLEFAHGIPGTLGGGVVMNAGAYNGELSDVVVSARWLSAAGEPGEAEGSQLQFSYRHSFCSDGQHIVTSVTIRLQPGDTQESLARIEDLRRRRQNSQPLEHPSAGSTFKRPPGHYAAALIDQCGLKGLQVGGAQVSKKHCGFVVNRGGATCADVLALTDQVKAEVLRQTGVHLELEVHCLF